MGKSNLDGKLPLHTFSSFDTNQEKVIEQIEKKRCAKTKTLENLRFQNEF